MADLAVESARYTTPDGQAGTDPLALTPQPPRFSLPKLALELTNPALELDALPSCPWLRVERRRPAVEWPEVPADRAELPDRFQRSVAACLGDSEIVAVALSGGLDSLAVLYHCSALCRREGRRLVAIVDEMLDDQGVPASALARSLIKKFAIDCELHVVGTDPRQLPPPNWSPSGPGREALPRAFAALVERAATLGAGVVLTGSGADELLQATPFLSAAQIRAGRWQAAWRYAADEALYGGAVVGLAQLLAMVAPQFPARTSFALYLAAHYPDVRNAFPGDVVADQYRPYALRHYRTWLDRWRERFVAQGRDWVVAAAWDCVFGCDMLESIGPVPQRSPFLEPDFAAYALAIPLHERYTPKHRLPYHRYKRLVLSLYPRRLWPLLPDHKHLYRTAIPEYAVRLLRGRRLWCRELGLVRDLPDETLVANPGIACRLAALEEWIDGAIERGASPTDDIEVDPLEQMY